jgi:hypothetical protein
MSASPTPPPAASSSAPEDIAPGKSPWLYRTVLALAAATAAVIVAFFGIGLADGSVSSFNIALWLAILVGVGAILLGGCSLHARGHRKSALVLLAVLAVPGTLYALLVILFVASGTRWN